MTDLSFAMLTMVAILMGIVIGYNLSIIKNSKKPKQ